MWLVERPLTQHFVLESDWLIAWAKVLLRILRIHHSLGSLPDWYAHYQLVIKAPRGVYFALCRKAVSCSERGKSSTRLLHKKKSRKSFPHLGEMRIACRLLPAPKKAEKTQSAWLIRIESVCARPSVASSTQISWVLAFWLRFVARAPCFAALGKIHFLFISSLSPSTSTQRVDRLHRFFSFFLHTKRRALSVRLPFALFF